MTDANGHGPAERIAALFNRLFTSTHRTVMQGGGAEPLFLPATRDQPARLVYTRDYAASALHEAAHWCIAGAGRREKIDYGYRYVPPPRSASTQAAFYRVEWRVQALEMLLSRAAGLVFTVSADDCSADVQGRDDFRARLDAEARRLERTGLPPRAAQLQRALASVPGWLTDV